MLIFVFYFCPCHLPLLPVWVTCSCPGEPLGTGKVSDWFLFCHQRPGGTVSHGARHSMSLCFLGPPGYEHQRPGDPTFLTAVAEANPVPETRGPHSLLNITHTQGPVRSMLKNAPLYLSVLFPFLKISKVGGPALL